jgi:hypothetical protein
MAEIEVLRWECPKCGKKIKSLYSKQLENSKKIHLLTHEEENGT